MLRKENKIIEKELSYKMVGIFFSVQKNLGRFCREKQYADAIENELKKAQISYKREYPIILEGKKSNFVDFLIENRILVDLKAKPFIEKEDYYQMKRYLETTNLKLGLIVNFRQRYLRPKRVLNSKRTLKGVNTLIKEGIKNNYYLQHSHSFVVSHRADGFPGSESSAVTPGRFDILNFFIPKRQNSLGKTLLEGKRYEKRSPVVKNRSNFHGVLNKTKFYQLITHLSMKQGYLRKLFKLYNPFSTTGRSARSTTGFTMIELLVAMALFVVIVTVAVGSFVIAMKSQRAQVALMAVNDNVSLAIEQMAREIRTGTGFCPGNSCVLDNDQGKLVFTNYHSEQVTYNYKWDSNLNIGMITRNGKQITADNVDVQRLRFKVSQSSTQPPRVTIILRVAVPQKGTIGVRGVSTDLQTTISARNIQ